MQDKEDVMRQTLVKEIKRPRQKGVFTAAETGHAIKSGR